MLQSENIESDNGLPNQSYAFHLLQNEKLNSDLTAMLQNISAENITTLLINVQNNSGLDSTGTSTAGTLTEPNLNIEKDSEGIGDIETPMSLIITLSICYALIFFAGVLGNLITCIVIARNNFMHTATNFYLFNLAVSDLILLSSGMPQELYNLWHPDSYPFTDAICIMGSVLAETATNATVLTITAFTVERYIAICHPFRQHTMSKLSRAIKFIFAIWLMALLLALPQAVQFSVIKQSEGGYSCTMENDFYAHVFAVSGFIFFCGPMTAICVLYVLIGVKLKRSRLLQSLPRRSYDINRGLNAQSRVIRMLVAVAVAFFLCWAPFHAQRLMAVYGSSLIDIGINREDFHDYFRILDYTSGVLYFLSTCINPLLYNIMSHKFREAFKITLTRQFGLSSRHPSQHYNYSAVLRQNGSMRFHTTVNNNALEPFGSYRVVQFRCRDPSHHFSLQDSIRTTTTTTTINSMSGGVVCGMSHSGNGVCGNGVGGGGGSSRRSSHRNHCISVAMPKTAASCSNGSTNTILLPHRKLQTQISQLSSMGDVNSLLEAEVDAVGSGHVHHFASASYRAKRAVLNNPTPKVGNEGEGKSGHISTTAGNKPLESANATTATTSTIIETELKQPSQTKVVTHIPHNSQPTRSRLKLSRIIMRREHEQVSFNQQQNRKSSNRAELFERQSCSLPICDELNVRLQHKSTTKLENIAEKLHLRRQRIRTKKAKEKDQKTHRVDKETTETTSQIEKYAKPLEGCSNQAADLSTKCGNSLNSL